MRKIVRYLATIRKRAGAAAGDQNQYSLALFPEQNSLPVLRIDRNGSLIYANSASGPLLAQWQCSVGQRLPEIVARTVEDSLAKNAPQELEINISGRNISFVTVPIKERNYANLYAHDITDRKRVEEALRESEERLSFALETIHAGAWDLDLENHTAYRSLEHDRIFGYEQLLPQWTYEMFLDHVLPQDRPMVDAKFSAAISGRSDLSFECRIRRVDGEVRWIWASGQHRKNASGRTGRMVGIVQDITERKQAEDALRESREDLNRAQAVAHIGSWRLDTRRNELLWSAENYRIFGITEGTPMTYETFLDIAHPEDRQYIDEKWTAALRGGPYDIEHRIVVGNTVKWVRELAELEFDEDGVLKGGFGTTQDITEKKRAEEVLRQRTMELQQLTETLEHRVKERTITLAKTNEELQAEITVRKTAEEAVKAQRKRFNDVLELLPAYLVLLTPDYHVTFANRFFRERFGEDKGRRCFEYLFGLTEPCEACETYTILKTMSPHKWEWAGPDGRIYDISDFPFTDVDGSTLIMEVGLDITERKKAEEAVKAERQRLFDVLETLPFMISLLTPDYHIIFANRSFRQQFGESEGRHCYDYCFGRSEPCEFCESYNVLKTGQPHHWEVTLPDGRSIIDAYDFPFTDIDGTPLILEMDIDITERKKAEEEIQKLNRELEQRVMERTAQLAATNQELRDSESHLRMILHEKETLLKEIHHRVKNNLQIIYSMLDLQLPGIKDKQAIDIFKESQNRIYTMALIHEKLYQSKSLARIDLAEYIQSLTNNLFISYGVSERTVRPVIHIEDVSLDIDRVIPCALIINELVSNSLKHAFWDSRQHADGMSEILIDLRKTNGNKLVLTVSDNGVGLPRELEIERCESLGLRLVNVLIKQLKGTVQLGRPCTGEGTEFIITFKAPE